MRFTLQSAPVLLMLALLLINFITKCYDVSSAETLVNNQCPPREIVFENKQNGIIESQRSNSGINCVVTALSSDVSQVFLFTFVHIPPAIEIRIFNGDSLYNQITDCNIETGKQCFSIGPIVTFQFITFGRFTDSTATVELFMTITSLQHAKKLVLGNGTSGLKTWQICVIVGVAFVSLCLIGMIVSFCIFCFRRKREKKQLKTMQTCMIHAHPRIRPVNN